ncbi:GSCFA domain-containing protein [Euzebyella marina]|uniref:GSCFA domain-containing protein n=1 Tax=Euzebyella marina TaxID=1761453 RepID=A0A3G2L3C9_9FLAO|nr:GSCFA domain-containing protein [Euzebyella marina]AYN66728.1 GSCFA domain-containing protein [Euzebyella marina]
MELQTQIPLKKEVSTIDYKSQILLLGSCFSENIGKKIGYYKFSNLINPFGILFHPLAIENLVQRSVEKRPYNQKEIFHHNGLWHSYDAHSDLSDLDPDELLKRLNKSLDVTSDFLKTATHVIITLGTSWVYKERNSENIVANCHKVPQKQFIKELLSIGEIEESLLNTINKVKSANKNMNIIFTISPVRHLKDGFVENQRSKAHLISAVHSMVDRGHSYFPSYELQMDELRDYRFYKEDMVHPNKLAIDYIWNKFKMVWISEGAYQVMDEIETVQKGLAHKPFQPKSEAHQQFLKNLQTKIKELQDSHPHIKFGG